MKFLGLSFLLGLLSATGFQPLGLWPLTILAFAGLFLLIEQAPSMRSAARKASSVSAMTSMIALPMASTSMVGSVNCPLLNGMRAPSGGEGEGSTSSTGSCVWQERPPYRVAI